MEQIKKVILTAAIIGMLLFLIFNTNQTISAQSQPTLSLIPSTVTINSLTDTFTLAFKISGVTNLWGWSANITWDTQYVTMAKAPIEGDFLSQSGHQTAFTSYYNKTSASLKGPVADVGLDSGAQSGDGTLATFTFQVLKPVVGTKVTINATALLTNQTSSQSVPEYTVPINPFPASTYASATVSYVPSGGIPVPDAGLNQTVNQHTDVILNASSTLPQDPTQNFTWTFFDNESRTLTGMVANYTFDWPGTFLITLTVTNSNGTAIATVGITVNDITPPIAVITINNYPSGQNIPVNTLVRFNSSQCYDPYNLTLKSPDWNFGDNSASVSDPNPAHTYSNPGTYTVSLAIQNSAGQNATTTQNIVVGGSSSSTTANPNQTNSPNNTSFPSTSDSGHGTSSPQNSFTLPPAILYTLIFVTVFVLGGSVFWLKKKV